MKRDTATWKRLDLAHVWHPFTQMNDWAGAEPLVIERGEGSWLIDTDGKRYLDGVSSLWTNVHGHAHPEINLAIREQLDKVAHSTLLGLASTSSIELAAALAEVTPAGLTRVFYSDSGSTAAEVALKIAFQYQAQRGQPQRTKFLALRDAYHGDTLGAVSAGGIELFHQIFKPLLFHVEHIAPDPTTLATVLDERSHEIAGLILEPLVQGAAGMVLHPPGFLAEARRLTKQHDVLLICDEVATGFGRTGTLFACEQEQVVPDLLCLAKGISGGYLPLAATVASDAIYEQFLGPYASKRTFFHGHTYTGNPLACAAGLASLRILQRDQVIEQLPAKIERLRAGLAATIAPLPHVLQIRQRGMMIGIELAADVATRTPYAYEAAIGAQVCRAVRNHGVILRPLGPVIVWMPPLSITPAEIDLLIDATAAAITEVTAKVSS